MMRITGIGANVYDTLYTVDSYPDEDTKKRAKNAVSSGGGPTATGLVAASKLGADVSYVGVLTTDAPGIFLKADMEKYGVDTSKVKVVSGYSSFSSCIFLSEKEKTRTCVFYKGDIPALKLSDEQKGEIEKAGILMVDGNEMDAAIEGAKKAHESGAKVLYDAGGLYDGVGNLIKYADILIPSEEFALGFTKKETAEEAAKALYEAYHPDVVVITQGKKGGIMFSGKEIIAYPALPAEVVDSNGAGDVFHGAFAFAYAKGFDMYKCCIFSSAVSALKCTKLGARSAVPEYKKVIEFLKELGYNEFEEDLEK